MADSDAGVNGARFLVLVNTGTPSVPVYTAVGSQRDATVDEASANVDYSSKNSRAQRVGYGRYSSTLSLDHLYIAADSGYLALKAANRNGDMILVARELDDVALETADAKVDSMSENYPDQGESVISCALTIDGEWTEVGT